MGKEILDKIRGGLIVSCQALADEPLHGSYIMSRMASAAMQGGAAGIRANSVEDILAIKKEVNLPVIGIIKAVYGECPVYITPTMKEVDALAGCGAVDVIATDCTGRERPDGRSLQEFYLEIRGKYPDQLLMADCSCYEEGMYAAELGFDLIGTTLSGYTEYTKGRELPDFELMRRLVCDCGKPVIAEGGIWTPDQLKTAMETGVLAAVVGTAITRPMNITRRFVDAIR